MEIPRDFDQQLYLALLKITFTVPGSTLEASHDTETYLLNCTLYFGAF